MFSRIAIVNRGEAAMRLVHAVRDLNAAAGPNGHRIEVVALHTTGERRAMFVREADVAYDLGPAADRPYLDHAVLERALVETKADAAWVGWGFVAEDPAFADLCERIGVTFIGPSGEAMRKLGDKIGSKLIAEEVGVPVAPWSRGGVDTLDEALAAAERIGYPLMLKATAGGGGRGIRKVENHDDLADAYQRTRDEALRAFGSGVVFLEKLVTGARHVEVQVIADGQGTAWAIGVRDCSVQRRNQKVIEESSSVVMTPEQAQVLKDSAERLAVAVGYAGAGTVEFLFQPTDGTFAFLEVNTRLQVEHPITEVTTDTDLVRLQIHVAAGGRLTGERPVEVGHAVEARLNAEDPDRDFAPAPGHIDLLVLPAGPGIRVDTGVAEGDTIPADFDSMIAKIIAYGRTRDDALARLRRAMTETHVIIDGGATNKSFVLDLLDQPEVIDGSADTGWIDRVRGEGRLASATGSGVALVMAGIEAYCEAEALESARLLETARGGRPQVRHEVGAPVELKLRGTVYAVTVLGTGPDRYRVTVAAPGAEPVTVSALVERLDRSQVRLTVDGATHRLLAATHGPVQLVEVDGVMHRVSRDEGGVLRSPAPALVVATPVAVGDVVEAGQAVLVLESMKMETVIPAPYAATVRELPVRTGSQVETGAPLVRLEPTGDAADAPAAQTASVDLGLVPADDARTPRERLTAAQDDLVSAILGFDVDPDAHPLARFLAAADEADEPTAGAPVLAVLADVADLGRTRPGRDEVGSDLAIHSTREHFHTYLRSLDADRDGLPQSFRDRLLRALAHYGVDSLDRSPELEDALFRLFLAQQSVDAGARVGTAILERWARGGAPTSDDGAAEVLDRLAVSTQRRFPPLAELARSVHFTWFDQPRVEAQRAGVLDDVRAQVEALPADPGAADARDRVDALVAIPEQISSVLAARLADGVPTREPMLEVLARRHYRGHDLTDVRAADDRPLLTASYVLDGRPTRFVSAVGRLADLAPGSDLVAGVAAALAAREPGQEGVVDLYLAAGADLPDDLTAPAADVVERVAATGLLDAARRVTVGLVGTTGPVRYVTVRSTATDAGPEAATTGAPAGAREDTLVHDVHPMVGRRLDLWRLTDFDLERLPAPDDVLLYKAVAKGNPGDQRLVAMTQVRQFAVTRDDDGRVTAMPHVERAVANGIEAIRRARAAAGPKAARSLDGNLVWVTLWPPVDAPLEELTALRSRVAPLAAGTAVAEVAVKGEARTPDGGLRPLVARFSGTAGSRISVRVEEPTTERLKPLDAYAEKVQRARRRGMAYPYELADFVAGPGGTIVEHDLSPEGRLVPVDRPYGLNEAGIIAAVVTTPTDLHPQGITRVLLAGDPLKALGSLGEPECSRVIAALDLAEEMKVPVEWYSLSAGARISMDSGTENLDWIAKALKRIVEFTQAGGEINVVVAGINVGGQPYWNAEATMLMHTKGILVMTPDSAMVLTGKQSLDFSGGVSAEDNFGIGGYDRVMGPNGQAQYWAPDITGALDIVMAHYEHAYIAPGEDAPRVKATTDPDDRDVTAFPHVVEGSDFTTVGDIFAAATNPDRKKPFDIRTLMRSVVDQDHATMERWAGMADAETSVVWDAHLGGMPVTLVGIESKPVPRKGFPPADGPDTYTAGTLFPRSSKKTARAINASSGDRPVVVLANLSGFDGSPDSLRNLQLEYGAEIGRALVNFEGKVVFVVVSRYHGGAFVVFSKGLNPNMTVLAIEGSYASVLGGAPAAAVVFSRDVDARAAKDPRVVAAQAAVDAADGPQRAGLAAELAAVRAEARADMITQVATEFDGVHDIHRAVRVGSVDEVIRANDLRPKIIGALRSWRG